MPLKANWRKIHYWLGLVVLIPVVIWIVTGVGFALLPRDEMNGQYESRGFESPPVSFESARLDPSRVPSILGTDSGVSGEIRDIQFFNHPLSGRSVYLVRFARSDTPALIDAASERVISRFSETEAAEIARLDYTDEGGVTSVEWIYRRHQKGRDYGLDLPVYRVNFSNPKKTRLYISPYTGKIISRRNVYMSAFSLIWNLHIFAWVNPELQFNPGVLFFSVLSLVSVLAGMFLWRSYLSKSAEANSIWRKTHVWLGWAVAAQVLIWIVGGIAFTLITNRNMGGVAESRMLKSDPPPDEIVHRIRTPLPPLSTAAVRIMPWQVPELLRQSAAALDAPRIEDVVLHGHGLEARPVYRVRIRGDSDPYIFSAETGRRLQRLTEDDARVIAQRDFDGPGDVRDVEWVTGQYQKGYDYFGELPVYRVNFTNWKRTRIYISPVTGQILARRNIHNSLFYSFYEVHVFSYVNRSRIGNPGIIISGILTFLAVVAGTLLYFPYFRRKKTNGVEAAEPSGVGGRQRMVPRG